MEIRGRTADEVYLEAVRAVTDYGNVVSPRGQLTRELTDVTLVIDDPTRGVPVNVGRRMNLKIGAVEYVQLLGGFSSLRQLNAVSGQRFSSYADDDHLLGAYGPRTYGQFQRAIERLSQDGDSRQAVVLIWRHDELTASKRDVPCTLLFQFLIRDNKLHMITEMRSNDVWLGTPYDLYSFTRLQLTLAWALKVDVGSYHHHVGSFHIYEQHVELGRGLVLRDKLRDAPPALITENSRRRKDDRASLFVGRFNHASRAARAVSFPHLYPRSFMTQRGAGFEDTFNTYRDLVPALDESVKLCELGCRYEFTEPSRSRRICPTCHAQNYETWKLRQKNHALARWQSKHRYEDILKRNGGRCEICNHEPKRWLVMDHNHMTETFRGLLCEQCNHALGMVRDDVGVLENMIEYLKKNRPEEPTE